LKVTYSVLAFFWPLKETGRGIFPNASIFFPLKPINGESEGYYWLLLNFIWSKALTKMISVELPKSMRTLLIS
jgi:hypothetical protein